MVVMGPWMHRLGQYMEGAKPDDVNTLATGWDQGSRMLTSTAKNMIAGAPKVEEGFSSTSLSGQASRRAMEKHGTATNDKAGVIEGASSAMYHVQSTLAAAVTAHESLKHSLPHTYIAEPDPSDHKYAQKGIGIDPTQAAKNKAQLGKDQAAYSKQEASVAHAETIAQQHVTAYDEALAYAYPKVKALYDNGEDDASKGGGSAGTAGGPTGPLPEGTSTSVPGSRSDVAAAHARAAQYVPNEIHRDGHGSDLIAAEHANAAAAMQTNTPEWDASQGMWVQADGTPAPTHMYAAIETPDGLSPLNGAAMAGAGLGVAGLGAGALALAKNGAFGARMASAFAGGAKATSAKVVGARVSGAKLSAAEEARLRGPGSRAGLAAEAEARNSAGARSGPGSAGSRSTGSANRPGSRAGGAAGRGQRKDKKGHGKNAEYVADYTDDWIDPDDDK